jgi:hypothetical protein
MAYLDSEEEGGPRGGNITKAIVGIVVAAAISFGWRYWNTGFGFTRSGWTIERIDSELRQQPDSGPVFVAIRTHYRAEYDAFLRRILPAVQAGDEAAVAREGFSFSRQFMVNHINDLARAPANELQQIAHTYAELVEAFRRTDTDLCARFVTTGLRPGDRPAGEARTIVARTMALQVAASRSGEGQRRDPRGAASDADSTRFEAALRARSPEAALLIFDQARLNAAPPAQQCAAGLAVHQTIAALPAETSANLTVNILRASFGVNPPAG